jgi:hypothetical protein
MISRRQAVFSCICLILKTMEIPSRSINEGLGWCLGNHPAYGSCRGVLGCNCIGMYLYPCLEYCCGFLVNSIISTFQTIIFQAKLCPMCSVLGCTTPLSHIHFYNFSLFSSPIWNTYLTPLALPSLKFFNPVSTPCSPPGMTSCGCGLNQPSAIPLTIYRNMINA